MIKITQKIFIIELKLDKFKFDKLKFEQFKFFQTTFFNFIHILKKLLLQK